MPFASLISNGSGLRDNHTRGSVADFLREKVGPGSLLSVVSAYFTIYAYGALKETLDQIEHLDFLFGEPTFVNRLDPSRNGRKSFVIDAAGLSLANKLQQKRVARECADWIVAKVDIRTIKQVNLLHGKMYHVASGGVEEAILGSSNFTVAGLGLGASGNNIELNLIVDSNRDRADLRQWFAGIWNDQGLVKDVKEEVLLAQAPALVRGLRKKRLHAQRRRLAGPRPLAPHPAGLPPDRPLHALHHARPSAWHRARHRTHGKARRRPHPRFQVPMHQRPARPPRRRRPHALEPGLQRPRRLAPRLAARLYALHLGQPALPPGPRWDGYGNRFLLDRPEKLALRVSRKATEGEIRALREEALEEAAQGTVMRLERFLRIAALLPVCLLAFLFQPAAGFAPREHGAYLSGFALLGGALLPVAGLAFGRRRLGVRGDRAERSVGGLVGRRNARPHAVLPPSRRCDDK